MHVLVVCPSIWLLIHVLKCQLDCNLIHAARINATTSEEMGPQETELFLFALQVPALPGCDPPGSRQEHSTAAC